MQNSKGRFRYYLLSFWCFPRTWEIKTTGGELQQKELTRQEHIYVYKTRKYKTHGRNKIRDSIQLFHITYTCHICHWYIASTLNLRLKTITPLTSQRAVSLQNKITGIYVSHHKHTYVYIAGTVNWTLIISTQQYFWWITHTHTY